MVCSKKPISSVPHTPSEAALLVPPCSAAGSHSLPSLKSIGANHCTAAFPPPLLWNSCVYRTCFGLIFSLPLQSHHVFYIVLMCRSAGGHLHLCKALQNVLRDVTSSWVSCFHLLAQEPSSILSSLFITGTFHFSNKIAFTVFHNDPVHAIFSDG